jgi:hypothetical protein
VLEGRCLSYGASIAYLPLFELVPRHWSIARSMPGTQARLPKPKACSAAQYARRAILGTCEGTRHEGVGNDD